MNESGHGFIEDESGMTLTELIAAMAVAFILMVFMIHTYTFTGNLFQKTAGADDLARTTQAVMNYLEDTIACADTLEISGQKRPDTEGLHELEFSGDGRIYRDGEPVYDAEFYRNRKVFCRILPVSGGTEVQVIKYRLTWMNTNNTALYSADSVVKLLNLELGGKTVIRSGQDTGTETAGKALYFYYSEAEDGTQGEGGENERDTHRRSAGRTGSHHKRTARRRSEASEAG